ncbi:MAG: protein kinase [Acidobacteria bacterium]|nr:protein kinase [Acidobacteriota bacterium]
MTAAPGGAGGLPAGRRIGRYRIDALLGRGGMGEVYRATDEKLARTVALKLLPAGAVPDDLARARAIAEARAACSVSNPHVATVLDVLEHDGAPVLVMEFVDGERLDEALGRGLDRARLVRYFAEIADALAAIHAAGLVHGDLKPGNVLVTASDHAKVLDFGVARPAVPREPGRDETAPTQPGGPAGAWGAGTIAYMSPEQLRGEPLDRASDMFSFGVILCEALSGTHPFRRASLLDTAHAVLRENPPADALERCGTLRGLVQRLLEKDRGNRGGDAAQVRAELLALTPSPAPPRVTLPPRGPRRRALWIGAALVAAAALALGAWAVLRAPRRPAPVPPAEDVLVLERRARQLVDEERAAEAIAVLERAVAAHPEAAGPRALLARTLFRSGFERRAREAALAARTAAASGAVGAETGAEVEATYALVFGHRDEEVRAWRKLAALRRDDPRALRGLARALLDAGAREDALQQVERALALDPLEPAARLVRGEILLELGRLDEATEEVDGAERAYRLLEQEVGLARAAELRGHIEFARADFPAAVAAYAAAAERYSSAGLAALAAQARKAEADVRLKLGDTAAAAELYRAAEPELRAAGSYALLVNMLGSEGAQLYLAGQFDAAESALRAALDEARRLENPRLMLSPLSTLANLLAYRGRADEARDVARQALALARETGDRESEFFARMTLGDLELQEGALREAERTFRTLAEEEQGPAGSRERRAYALIALAQVLETAERPGPALDCALESVRLNRELGLAPDLGYALVGAARLEARLGLFADAGRDLDEAERIASRAGLTDLGAAARVARGTLALRRGEFAEAARLLSGPAPDDPGLAVAHATALVEAGQVDAGATLLRPLVGSDRLAPPHRARAELALAIALRRAGDPAGAASHAGSALAAAEELGLALTAARAAALLARLPGADPAQLARRAAAHLERYLADVPASRRAALRTAWDVRDAAP